MGTGGSWTNPKLYSGKSRGAGSQKTGKRRQGVMVSIYGRLREQFPPGSEPSRRTIKNAEAIALKMWRKRPENQRPKEGGPDHHPLLDEATPPELRLRNLWTLTPWKGQIVAQRASNAVVYLTGHPVERVIPHLPDTQRPRRG